MASSVTIDPDTGVVKTLHPYYSFDRVFSYNAFWMYVVGARGLGKTYGAKEKAIMRALTKGEQFIYLRRYKDEIKAVRTKFFSDLIANNVFPEWDFKIEGDEIKASPKSLADEKKRPWRVIGYFAQLSTAAFQKSVSYDAVTLIIFDEFIIEKGMIHYLPNEATAFAQFYSTVDRWKDKTRVLFLANSVSIMNPYFMSQKIDPREGEWVRRADGYIVAHFAKSSDFAASVSKTRFGQFIEGTEYEDFAVGNKFHDANTSMVERKPADARYMFTFHTREGVFSIWSVMASGVYYAQQGRPRSEINYALEPGLMKEGMELLTYSDVQLQVFRAAFKQGRVRFDVPQTRNAIMEVYKR